jgi:hypothetical protein
MAALIDFSVITLEFRTQLARNLQSQTCSLKCAIYWSNRPAVPPWPTAEPRQGRGYRDRKPHKRKAADKPDLSG